jgi:hypothetical protein
MNDELPVITPTFLRLKLIYAAFTIVIFLASGFLAITMADSGLSNMAHAENSYATIVGMVFLVVGVIAIVGSSIILLQALIQVWLAFQLERKGQIIEAVVLQKRLEKDQKDNRYCFIVYSFNKEFSIKQSIPQAEYNLLTEGDTVKVRYLPKNPEIARLEKV